MISALIVHGIPIECINQAAITYIVPAKVIISVLATEGATVGTASRNKNGTYDFGPMQINSSWLTTLKKYGYTQEEIQFDPCVNVMVGTWILSHKIADTASNLGDYWHGVASYNSVTPTLNARYKTQVLGKYQLLSDALAD